MGIWGSKGQQEKRGSEQEANGKKSGRNDYIIKILKGNIKRERERDDGQVKVKQGKPSQRRRNFSQSI